MGGSISKGDLAGRVKGALMKPKTDDVVLVPPLFERDFRGRSRMTVSAYDWMSCKPGLKWLFSDYIRHNNEIFTLWRLTPSEDPRFTIHARLAAQGLSRDQLNGVGRVALRFQPDIAEPLTFVDLKTGTQSGPVLRTCNFSMANGVGFWNKTALQDASDTTVGVRYSSPDLSAGVITRPLKQQLDLLWLVGRNGPFSAGVQVNLKNQPEPTTVGDLGELLKQKTSISVAYSPESQTGRANFATVLELKEQSQLTVSLLYHMAVQRLCRNPMEGSKVVGVTNYIDLGLQVTSDVAEVGKSANGQVDKPKSVIGLAGSWQVNKNWLVKARLGSESASAAVALKAWWHPSMTFAFATTYDYYTRTPRIGFTYALENYGNIRYERQGEKIRFGKALVQRHVALPEDITNKEGQGLLVDSEDLNNKAILGQTQPESAHYL